MAVKKETRRFDMKMDMVAEEGVFTGYASTFGNVDQGNDIIDPSAFRKTLAERGVNVPILDHHDPLKILGYNEEAHTDRRGLFVKGRLNLEVSRSREVLALIKQGHELGVKFGLSIGFQTVKAEADKNVPGARRIKELRLFEYSIVVFPMNEMAGIEAVKVRDAVIDDFCAQMKFDEEKTDRLRRTIVEMSEPARLHSDPWEPVNHSLNELINTATKGGSNAGKDRQQDRRA